MGIVKGGVFGNITKKVGDVTFSVLKGQNVAKRRVIPANPKTAAQMNQRNKMRFIVSIWQKLYLILGNVSFEALTSLQSAYNSFVSINIANVSASAILNTSFLVSRGKLDQLQALTSAWNNSTKDLTFTWDAAVIKNGSVNDNVRLLILKEDGTIYLSQGYTMARSDEGLGQALPGIPTGVYYAFVITSQGIEYPFGMFANSQCYKFTVS